MLAGKTRATIVAICTALALAGCTSTKSRHGYVYDPTLANAIQPGIDNMTSVEATLGRPSYTSEFGPMTWYYVTTTSEQRPFSQPKIQQLNVMAVKFDNNGSVVAAEFTGKERMARITPDGDKTPTLGRQRSFFEDLFGNVGAVGSLPTGAGGQGGP